MSSKYNLVIPIASLVLVVALCATYHPTFCNKKYTECITKGNLEEHVCKEKQLKCIVEYCDDRAKIASKRRGRGPYLAQLFKCAIKWKLPFEALDLIEDYMGIKW
ncbi:hypothetical protein ScPMuIL_017348 [Solemya velum]